MEKMEKKKIGIVIIAINFIIACSLLSIFLFFYINIIHIPSWTVIWTVIKKYVIPPILLLYNAVLACESLFVKVRVFYDVNDGQVTFLKMIMIFNFVMIQTIFIKLLNLPPLAGIAFYFFIFL